MSITRTAGYSLMLITLMAPAVHADDPCLGDDEKKAALARSAALQKAEQGGQSAALFDAYLRIVADDCMDRYDKNAVSRAKANITKLGRDLAKAAETKGALYADDPRRPDGQATAFRYYEAIGDHQEANRILVKAVQVKPEDLPHDTFDPATRANSVACKSDVWMTLAKSTKTASVRLRFPVSLEKPIPVLFVFHGAGGSENMFFETYGAGRVIREAEKRGWLVVSPGQGMFGLSLGISDMLDVLEPFAKLNRSRIMVLGHSMGAAQVMTQVQKHPSLPIAAVALGGGSRMAVKDPSQAPKAHWFVAAGEQDFGRSGARQLHRSLTDAGLQSQYRDYPDVEHLVIVQAAIDDSFKFLDEVLGVKD